VGNLMHTIVRIVQKTTFSLETKDHVVCGVYALLIWFSLKLAFSGHLFIAITGWFWIVLNIMSFDSYALRRKKELNR